MTESTEISLTIPCNFAKEGFGNESISFDLLSYAKIILREELWGREFDYGYLPALKQFSVDKLLKAEMTIHPRFLIGTLNPARIQEIVSGEIGDIPDYLNVKEFERWPCQMGVAILKITVNDECREIPSEQDLEVYPPKFDQKFLSNYHIYKALLRELKFLFLAGIHLRFPSSSTMNETENIIDRAVLRLSYRDKIYAKTIRDETFLHDVLIEESSLDSIEVIHRVLASKWHLNLWSLRRYLTALGNGNTSMDNLLDLLYSLEGLFNQNATTNHIKTMCVLNLCGSKQEGRKILDVLNTAFKIRNEIVHGAKLYSDVQKVKIGGRTVLAETVFWETKVIVSQMIIKSLLKPMVQKNSKSVAFNEEDLLELMFRENTIANRRS